MKLIFTAIIAALVIIGIAFAILPIEQVATTHAGTNTEVVDRFQVLYCDIHEVC
jgi:hypothetical protein